MNLYDEFFSIIKEFEKHQIAYAVIGGIAMAFHNYPRFTKHIDFIVKPEQINNIRKAVKNICYFESSEPWTFRNTQLTLHRFIKTEGEECLIIDVLTSADKQYRAVIENAVNAEWSEGLVKIADKDDIVRMKKLRNSDQDRVDIKKLKNDKD